MRLTDAKPNDSFIPGQNVCFLKQIFPLAGSGRAFAMSNYTTKDLSFVFPEHSRKGLNIRKYGKPNLKMQKGKKTGEKKKRHWNRIKYKYCSDNIFRPHSDPFPKREGDSDYGRKIAKAHKRKKTAKRLNAE
ncbi:hypothetical protein JXJ21_14275 [candidate division KSB1 bacterium]|nr:hypothetical protein [candidate division KSB1 bacterium]